MHGRQRRAFGGEFRVEPRCVRRILDSWAERRAQSLVEDSVPVDVFEVGMSLDVCSISLS